MRPRPKCTLWPFAAAAAAAAEVRVKLPPEREREATSFPSPRLASRPAHPPPASPPRRPRQLWIIRRTTLLATYSLAPLLPSQSKCAQPIMRRGAGPEIGAWGSPIRFAPASPPGSPQKRRLSERLAASFTWRSRWDGRVGAGRRDLLICLARGTNKAATREARLARIRRGSRL